MGVQEQPYIDIIINLTRGGMLTKGSESYHKLIDNALFDQFADIGTMFGHQRRKLIIELKFYRYLEFSHNAVFILTMAAIDCSVTVSNPRSGSPIPGDRVS